MSILGLNLEEYSRVRQYRGEYVFEADGEEAWRDIATIRRRGRAVGAGFGVNVVFPGSTVRGIRIVRASEVVVDEHADVINFAEVVVGSGESAGPPEGFREFPLDCHVEPGDKLQLLILDDYGEEGKVTGRVFVVADEDEPIPDVCVLGDGEHLGAPVAVMLTAIDSTLRLADHEADLEK